MSKNLKYTKRIILLGGIILSHSLLAQDDSTSLETEITSPDYSPQPCMDEKEEETVASLSGNLLRLRYNNLPQEESEVDSSGELGVCLNSTSAAFDPFQKIPDTATFEKSIQLSSNEIFSNEDQSAQGDIDPNSISSKVKWEEELKIASLAFSLAAHLASFGSDISSSWVSQYASLFIENYTTQIKIRSKEQMPRGCFPRGIFNNKESSSLNAEPLSNVMAAMKFASQQQVRYQKSSSSEAALYAIGWNRMAISRYAAEYSSHYAQEFFNQNSLLERAENLRMQPKGSLFCCFSSRNRYESLYWLRGVQERTSYQKWHHSWVLAASWLFAQEWDYALLQHKLNTKDTWRRLNEIERTKVSKIEVWKASRAIEAWSNVIKILQADSNSSTAERRKACLEIALGRKDFWSKRIDYEIVFSKDERATAASLHDGYLQLFANYFDVFSQSNTETEDGVGTLFAKSRDIANDLMESKSDDSLSFPEAKDSENSQKTIPKSINDEKNTSPDVANNVATSSQGEFNWEMELSAIDQNAREAEKVFKKSEQASGLFRWDLSHWKTAYEKAQQVKAGYNQFISLMQASIKQLINPTNEQIAEISQKEIFWEEKQKEAQFYIALEEKIPPAESAFQEAQNTKSREKWDDALYQASNVESVYKDLIQFIEQIIQEEKTPSAKADWENKLAEARQRCAKWVEYQSESLRELDQFSNENRDEEILQPFFPLLIEQHLPKATDQATEELATAVAFANDRLNEMSVPSNNKQGAHKRPKSDPSLLSEAQKKEFQEILALSSQDESGKFKQDATIAPTSYPNVPTAPVGGHKRTTSEPLPKSLDLLEEIGFY